MKILLNNMHNNTNNSDGLIPEEVLELVPWYAIGKLSVDDQALFEEALVSYPSLKNHVEIEQQMMQAVNADHSLLSKSAIAPTEERLKSVLNMIDIEESRTDSVQDSSIFAKVKNAFDSLIPSSNGVPQYARVASVGILVLSVAVMTAFVAPLFSDKSDFVPASAETQSKTNEPAVVNAAKTTLLVGFNGSSVELGENTVLKGKLIKVESVPEKEGMFKISFRDSLNANQIKETINSLLAQKELVWFAGEAY